MSQKTLWTVYYEVLSFPPVAGEASRLLETCAEPYDTEGEARARLEKLNFKIEMRPNGSWVEYSGLMITSDTVERPNWTVFCNVVSPEGGKWIGTGWEFFDAEEDAKKCMDRHNASGNCATMRPYFEKAGGARHSDHWHLGAAHRM